MTKTTKKQTKEEKALALTPEGIFHAMEKAVPKGATTEHVLEAAATLLGSSLIQINATKQDLHNILMHLEDWVLKKMQLKESRTIN
jgi:hypothetical protein